MANRRSDIIDAFTSQLQQINSVESRNVYSSYRWIDELNDYPAITYVPRREARVHRGDGRKLAAIIIELRGYVYDGDGSEAIAAAETLASEIEDKVDTFAASAREHAVESAVVVSVRTDEGLMHPYGVCDLTINITYDVEITT
jgi:hypothetical protein